MDNWRLLSDCLPAWLSAETGKGPDAETPGRVQGGVTDEAPPLLRVMPDSRSIITAPPTRRPTSAVVIDLVLWKQQRGHATWPVSEASRHF